jgi:hypothetical protein
MKGIPKRTKIEKIDEGIEFLPLNQWAREREREIEREREREGRETLRAFVPIIIGVLFPTRKE